MLIVPVMCVTLTRPPPPKKSGERSGDDPTEMREAGGGEAGKKDETANGRCPISGNNNNKSALQRSMPKILRHPSQYNHNYCWSYKYPNNVDPSLIYLPIIGFNTLLKNRMFPLFSHDLLRTMSIILGQFSPLYS